jgi:hypothetical protein
MRLANLRRLWKIAEEHRSWTKGGSEMLPMRCGSSASRSRRSDPTSPKSLGCSRGGRLDRSLDHSEKPARPRFAGRRLHRGARRGVRQRHRCALLGCRLLERIEDGLQDDSFNRIIDLSEHPTYSLRTFLQRFFGCHYTPPRTTVRRERRERRACSVFCEQYF